MTLPVQGINIKIFADAGGHREETGFTTAFGQRVRGAKFDDVEGKCAGEERSL
jgi:hypothetical protein